MQEYKIYNSKIKILRGLSTWIIVFLLSLSAAVYGVIFSSTLMSAIGFIIAFIMFVLMAPLFAQLFSSKPFLVFDKNGVTVNQGSKSVGFVPWKSIDRMGTSKIRGFLHLSFTIKDYKNFKKNLSSFQIALIDQNVKSKLPHVCISFLYSKNDLSSVYPVITDYFKKYR